MLASAVLVGLSLVGLASAAETWGGVYKLYTCNAPGRVSSTSSTAPWTARLDGLHTYFYDDCRFGGSFGIGLNLPTMRRESSAMLALERPAAGPKAAIGIVRYKTWITAELWGSGSPAFVDQGGAFGPPGGSNPDASPWLSAPLSLSNAGIYIRLKCSGGAPSDCTLGSAKPLQVRGVEADLYEDVPPLVEFESGTLLDGTSTDPHRTLSYSATDQESGVARIELLIGDRVVGTHDLDASGETCPHTDLSACPSRYAGDFVVGSAAIPPGDHSVSLRVSDAAGNRRVVTSPTRVRSGSTSSPASTPSASTGALPQLIASFKNSLSKYTTSFGKAARVRGRLVDAGGNALARARIRIREKPDRGGTGARKRFVITDPEGKFSYIASGRQSSRALQLDYLGIPGSERPVATKRLHLSVRTASSFSVSLRGVRVQYWGRVLARPIPKGGKRVYVQGRATGGRWKRFAMRATDSSGRFSGRYRLRVYRPGVRLQFRLELPRQPGYAFGPRTGWVRTRVVR